MKRLIAAIGLGILCACFSTPPVAQRAATTYSADVQGAGVGNPSAQAPGPDWAEGPGVPLSAYALRRDAIQPYDPAQAPRTHRLAPGESLADVAERYQVPLRALIEQNRLEAPFDVAAGAVIALPPPRFHVVAEGETLAQIARANHVDPRSLALLNRLPEPYLVSPGQRIALPAVATPTAAAPTPATARREAGVFVWPLRGEILARFGAQADGKRLDGVEIAAPVGARANAAAAGVVVYAGDDLAAYGALVLIRHDGGLVSTYGYGARALVREGQSVRAGEPVLEIGARGSSPARLLFQIRDGSRALDPLPLLGDGN